MGVVIADDRAVAFLQEPALTRNQVVALGRGESIGPYRLVQIESDRLVFEFQG